VVASELPIGNLPSHDEIAINGSSNRRHHPKVRPDKIRALLSNALPFRREPWVRALIWARWQSVDEQFPFGGCHYIEVAGRRLEDSKVA